MRARRRYHGADVWGGYKSDVFAWDSCVHHSQLNINCVNRDTSLPVTQGFLGPGKHVHHKYSLYNDSTRTFGRFGGRQQTYFPKVTLFNKGLLFQPRPLFPPLHSLFWAGGLFFLSICTVLFFLSYTVLGEWQKKIERRSSRIDQVVGHSNRLFVQNRCHSLDTSITLSEAASSGKKTLVLRQYSSTP